MINNKIVAVWMTTFFRALLKWWCDQKERTSREGCLEMGRSWLVLYNLPTQWRLTGFKLLDCFFIVYRILHLLVFIMSTPKSLPNNMGLMSVRPSVRPPTKSFYDSDEIWYVGRDRWLMHDSMPYDPIQGQGHETFKVRNSLIFKIYLLRHF